MNRKYDNGTRAFIWNAFNDVFYCLISPGVVFYGAPSVRGRVRRLCSSLGETSEARIDSPRLESKHATIIQVKPLY